MKFSFCENIIEGDSINYHTLNNIDIDKYSEWHHFNFNDDKNGLYGIFNLSLSGDIYRPNLGRAAISLVVFEKGKAWHGSMDLQPVEKVIYNTGSPDLCIGKHFVRFNKNQYQIQGSLKDGSINLNANWIPETTGIRITNIGGIISTFIIPRMRVEGTIQIEQKEYRFNNATGYHDHNWGYWDWGKDIGWDWGYMLQPRTKSVQPAEALSVVFGQVTDASRKTAKSDLVMLVWTGRECRQVFLNEAITLSFEGSLTGIDIRKLPGLMALLYPGHSHHIPKRILISAKDGEDHLKIALDTEHAIQFLIPHPGNTGKSVISELVGTYSIRGTLNGRTINFSYFGFTEVTS